jgi:hypothetical protein
MVKLELDTEIILSKLENLKPIENDSYLKVYSGLVDFCSRQEVCDATTLMGLSHMVYGWMPTIIKFDPNIKIEKQLFEDIKRGSIETIFLQTLKRAINNSIVGTSKLLHFMNPEEYPIWDSRVYRSITGKTGYNSRVNSVEIYIEYMNKTKKVIEELNMEELYLKLMEKGYCSKKVSDIRMIEMILFYSSDLNIK